MPVIALLGMQLAELALHELAMFTVVQVHHANIALPAGLDRALRGFIVTPFMHKVHRSRLRFRQVRPEGAALARLPKALTCSNPTLALRDELS